MSHKELTISATDENTIDLIIKTVNKLYSVIQIQDTDEGIKGEYTQERMMLTSKSTDGKTLVERTSNPPMMQPNSGGNRRTGLNRTKSAPPRNLPVSMNLIRKLQRSLRSLKRKLKYMKSLQSDIDAELTKQLDSLNEVVNGVKPSYMSLTNNDLENIFKMFLDLISKVPVSSVGKQKKKESSSDYLDVNGSKSILCLPAIHTTKEYLKRLAAFRYVLREFEELTDQRKICLLSFAVFPENKEVNRTMLMYWWIGEGILSSRHIPSAEGFLKPENIVKDILDDFTERNLIEPVEIKRKMEPSSYKMTPFVHSSVVLISKEIGLFDMYQKGGKPAMQKSKLNKVCLVEGSSSQPEAKCKRMSPENIETVFNVSERFPEFTCKWFNRMKKLRVLYLGRWDRTEREIEMDSGRVMKVLSSLRRLRFLSFQGISTIRSLSRVVCKLSELIILDLRDCYNLETLPDDIHKLKNLVYLDLTGCEALESVPPGLAFLDNLEVLKGFVLGDVVTAFACKLSALQRLKKLRKLSVTVHIQGFGLDKLINAIKKFDGLEKLKVRWGSKFLLNMKQLDKIDTRGTMVRSLSELLRSDLPRQLRKLDLQRFPGNELPECLWPQNIFHLEKLHLGSSRRLKGFGPLPEEPTDCPVKVLHLTSLLKLKVEWRELTQLYFPKLRLLETKECPRVTFCPCDKHGIWKSDKNDDSTTTL